MTTIPCTAADYPHVAPALAAHGLTLHWDCDRLYYHVRRDGDTVATIVRRPDTRTTGLPVHNWAVRHIADRYSLGTPVAGYLPDTLPAVLAAITTHDERAAAAAARDAAFDAAHAAEIAQYPTFLDWLLADVNAA